MFANATRFAALAAPFHDERGADVVVVLAKATFLQRGQRLVPADEQSPVRLADVPWDQAAVDAGTGSSVRYPADLGGEKPGADLLVVGSAFAPRPAPSVDVAVRAPGRTVTLRVHGERLFQRGALGLSFGPAVPFERAPITYERAYGGTSADGSRIEWRNPVGRGVAASLAELEGALAPCIEDPARPLEATRASTPMGLGAIPTFWLPRRDLAGTMDAAWQAERMPFPPLDFDPRFHQVAHPSLQLERPLRAGDLLATQGLCEQGLFAVTVPELPFLVHARRSDAPPFALPLVLDTALLEPEVARVELTYRRLLPLGRGATLLRELRLDVDA